MVSVETVNINVSFGSKSNSMSRTTTTATTKTTTKPKVKQSDDMDRKMFGCAFKYMKNQLEYKQFMNISRISTNNTLCKNLIFAKRERLYDLHLKNLKGDKIYGPKSSCIIDNLRNFHFGDASLVEFIYLVDKSMPKIRKEKALNEAGAALFSKTELALKLCAPEVIFEYELQKVKPKGSEVDMDQKNINYCLKKHLIETKFIDTDMYNFTVKPRNLTIDELDCGGYWNETVLDYSSRLLTLYRTGLHSPTVSESFCFAKTIRHSQYSDWMVKNWALSRLKISEEQKAAERGDYIRFMEKLHADLMVCEKAKQSEIEQLTRFNFE
jgi:hypothetical protein